MITMIRENQHVVSTQRLDRRKKDRMRAHELSSSVFASPFRIFAAMAAAATCICLQSACEEGVVNETRLLQLAAAAELKVRKVAAAPADLLVSKAGTTLAFMLWRSDAGGGNMTERAARLASSFKHAHVLVPHALIGKPLVLDAAARCGHLFVNPVDCSTRYWSQNLVHTAQLLSCLPLHAAATAPSWCLCQWVLTSQTERWHWP